MAAEPIGTGSARAVDPAEVKVAGALQPAGMRVECHRRTLCVQGLPACLRPG